MMEGINLCKDTIEGIKTKDHTPSSTVGTDQFEEGWELDDDVVIDHANPPKVITLEHATNNTILEHDIARPKVHEFEVVLPLETTLQERHLEHLQQQNIKPLRLKCLKGAPKTFIDHFVSMVATCEQIILVEAMSREDGDKWKETVNEKINSLKNNNTWELVPLLEGKKHVSSKWVF